VIHRRYLGPAGRAVHVASNVDLHGQPPTNLVVLLHQTPRSWDEYREVLELVDQPAMAVDTPGYGASDAPDDHTIEAYATPIATVLENLDIETVDVVGHHTGGLVAVEVATMLPHRVRRLVLSSTPLIDAAERARLVQQGGHGVDEVERNLQGTHLRALWNGRAGFYPRRRDLLDRFMADALRAADPAAGHRAVANYQMEARLPLAVEAVLCVGHAQDPFGMTHLEELAAATAATSAVIPDGHIPLEHTAPAFVEAVERFLSA
jgi:pimeloyl-ACP methyl ester carboxylesterase